jgi:hypothetical protein
MTIIDEHHRHNDHRRAPPPQIARLELWRHFIGRYTAELKSRYRQTPTR